MSDPNQEPAAGRRNSRGRRRLLVVGLVVGALIVLAAVAFANRSSNDSPALSGDQQAASAWVSQNTQMWSWMQSHWDEMTLMHQHWGDVSWMQANLADYAWMRDHWDDMAWMHDHWSGITWMYAGGMMSISAGGMMGQSGS